MSERRSIGAQLVGDLQLGCEALLLEQLAHQPQHCPAVAPTPNQHVEDLALVVDSTPEIDSPTGDPHHHLVKMPAVAGRGRRRRSRRAIAGPNFSTQRRTVS